MTPCKEPPGGEPNLLILTLSEFALIERLRQRLVGPPDQIWVGDDVAVVPGPKGAMLLAADAVVAGIHADLTLVGLDDMGWKAMVANVSDIAAVGGRPCCAVVTVAGPLGTIDFDLLYDGLTAASAAYGCPIVGGDLTSSATLVVSVAIVGDAGLVDPLGGPAGRHHLRHRPPGLLRRRPAPVADGAGVGGARPRSRPSPAPGPAGRR